jgi:hypothetical protein
VSSLTGTPLTRAWTETPLHVTGCGIIPAVAYEFRSSANGGVQLSDPLEIMTARDPQAEAQSWGDLTGGFWTEDPTFALPPEGATNFGDVQAAIGKFEYKPGPPPGPWVDLEIDQVINLGDVQFVVMAFEGIGYTEIEDLEFIGVHPADCP